MSGSQKVVDKAKAKAGEFVCCCKKTCSDGQCKDPKRVKQGVLVDVEQQQIRVMNTAALAAHEAVRVFLAHEAIVEPGAVVEPTPKPFTQLSDSDRFEAIKKTQLIMMHPNITPAQLHSIWVAWRKANGWSYSDVSAPSELLKLHPKLKLYAELPYFTRVMYELFVTVVAAIVHGQEAPLPERGEDCGDR